jgi:outer membrane lipoprotein carrier protein
MMRRLGFVLVLMLSSAAALAAETPVPAPVPASGVDQLRKFFSGTQTLTAQFKQVVLDEALSPIQESSGTLWISRPDKFRWNYEKPFKQEIVSDGSKISLYDKELSQVTERPLTGGLGYTPAVLLAGRGRLEDNFVVKALDPQGSVQWAQLVPKNKDGGFESIRVGFDAGKLRTLEMVDGFGNTTRVNLENVRENAPIGPEKFQFTAPAGVDVLKE